MMIAIVPAYNESKRITSVVRSLAPHVDEVCVIDDGSTDDTMARAREAGATVLAHSINMGQGAALETGHAYARLRGATAIVHFDGDGQFDPDDIVRARRVLEKDHVDIVLGSRFLGGAAHIPWLKRYIVLPIGRWVNYMFTRVRLTDAHNGFRVLGPRAIAEIKITQNGMAHATEIIEIIRKKELRYAEIPVTVRYHEYGQGMRGGLAIVKDLIIGKFVK